jgi:hypothetical protein
MTARGDLRPVDAARLVLGAAALLGPRWLLRLTGSADATWPRRATRVLGARYVVQSTAGVWLDERWVPEVDAAVDLVHAASMVGCATWLPRHRRLALSSGALALAFAVADLMERLR